MADKFLPTGLTEEHVALRDMVRDFVDRRVMPIASELEKKNQYPDELIDELASIGMFGITVSEEYGGSDVDYVSYGLIFEELARGWMALASLVYTTSSVGYLISEFGTDDQKKRFLPGIVAGKRMGAMGLTEPSVGSDLKNLATTAIREGDTYVVNGNKIYITHARHGNPIALMVKTDPTVQPAHRGGISILLLEQGTPGFSFGSDFDKLGHRGLELCDLRFDDARVPVDNLLGNAEGNGFYQIMAALDRGRIYMAAASTGMARAALETAIEYAKNREAFGAPIAQHQAIQLKIANMWMSVRASRLLYIDAARTTDATGRASVESGGAKVFAAEAGLAATYDAMQVLGGYGYVTDFPVERYFRDSALMPIGEGTDDIIRIAMAKELLK
jgi:alkylation response protein AidB-like acyl-CoA dehydrogenase